MAGLADDWPENRQTCVDVLCAYLRMPYEPDPGESASAPERRRDGALHGPQVTIDGLRLTGRVPSELGQQFAEYVTAHDAGHFI